MSTTPAEATLADLQPVSLPTEAAELPRVSLAELEDIYLQVLAASTDPDTRLRVLHRLADLEMLQGEEELAVGDTRQALFEEAVTAYQALLRDDPFDPANDRLLYQLSKAYDLNGENGKSRLVLEQLAGEYPRSQHFAEAKFRLAEIYFSAGDYSAAEVAYAQVAAHAGGGHYRRNALYMHGWAQFKRGRYRPAIASFSDTLDILVPADNRLDALARGERELALDCFRVLAVIFSYLEGPETIAAAYGQLGHRPYEQLLYQHLGALYLNQQRYRDSAETYRAFNRAWPASEHAHKFQINVIDTYNAGGFAELIIAEKQHYVESYGKGGEYWSAHSAAVREEITPKLKLFIGELATYHHALGQSGAPATSDSSREHFLRAGDYYQMFVADFPDDPGVADMVFLLAESRWEAGAYTAAIEAYERAAYDYTGFARAADAAYSAILGYDKLLAREKESDTELLRHKIDSQLRYAGHFPDDKRAPLVLSNAASALFELSEYQLAIIAAATLTRWHPAPGEDILVPAWQVMAHSHFERGEYAAAELAYLESLERMAVTDKHRPDIVERLAASIYRRGEALAQRDEHLAAADEFSRVMELAPESTVRVQAQYDAAGNYMEAGEYALANRLLTDFRHRFPSHPLTAGVALKLANNFQQLEQWEQAARELDGLVAGENDPQRQRQLLYLAAEHYDRADISELAIKRYRTYAHSWPEPITERFESMNRLGELYAQSGQSEKRLFWLRKIVATYRSGEGAPAEANPGTLERPRYLAAHASSELAELEYRSYRALSLRAPLARSLKKKKSAMQRALQSYRETNDYGIARFSTLATFRMAEIYRDLSAELLGSERPANMDELALEQYELLLEEQAFPFEEKAIEIHEANARRSWEGVYDEWVQHSFTALGELMPVRYSKSEIGMDFSGEIY
jgi:TolA-binding protein